MYLVCQMKWPIYIIYSFNFILIQIMFCTEHSKKTFNCLLCWQCTRAHLRVISRNIPRAQLYLREMNVSLPQERMYPAI